MDSEDNINMFFNDEDDEEHNDEENNDDGNDVEGERRGRQKRSSWWQHYVEVIENGSIYAKCNYCPKYLTYNILPIFRKLNMKRTLCV